MKDKLRLKICKIGVALLEIFLISVIILTAAAVIEVTIFDFGFSDMVRIWNCLLYTSAASAGAAGRYNHGFIIPQTQQSAVVQ